MSVSHFKTLQQVITSITDYIEIIITTYKIGNTATVSSVLSSNTHDLRFKLMQK